ncbi:MAG: MFS transporter [Planctomycetes bacterium]|nr:MFS transporter [Planctomycetota bacterium]
MSDEKGEALQSTNPYVPDSGQAEVPNSYAPDSGQPDGEKMKPQDTAEKDKVPVGEKVAYGLGSGSFQVATDGVRGGLAYDIFNVTLHVPPQWLGLVLMFYRFFDALTDPLMGKISDNFRSRFGRRKPFIFVGSFMTAVAFILVWQVPTGWSHWNILIYYMLALFFFDICNTIQTVPYHTLGLEMSADYHERTSVSGYKMIFSFAFTLMLPWVFRIAKSDYFPDPMTGVRFLSYFVAVMVVVGGILPAIFVKERYYHIAKSQAKISFWKGLKLTFSNRAFLLLTGILLLVGIGNGLVANFSRYIVYYYIFGGNIKEGAELAAIGANVSQVGALICVPLMTLVSKKLGKIPTLKALIVLGIIGSLSTLIFYNTSFPWLILASSVIGAPMVAGYWTITGSMKADICDDDELRHGMRREGMFGAIGNWVIKTALSLTAFLAGSMLWVTGFNAELEGAQDPTALLKLRLFFAFIPAAFSIAGLIVLHFYPLNEHRMAEIRRELEARRKEVV